MPELLDLLPAAAGALEAGSEIAGPAIAGSDLAAGALSGAGAAGAAGGLDLAASAGGLAASGLSGAGAGAAAGGLDFGADTAIPSNALFTSGQGNLTDMAVSGPGINLPALDPNTGLPLSQPGMFDATSGAGGGWAGTMASGPASGGTPGANILSSLDPGAVSGASGGAAGVTPSASAGTSLLDSLTSGITKQATSNPFGIAAAGGGLALNLLKGNQSPSPALDQQRQLSAGAEAQARQMTSYLASGTLPPGLQTAVDQAVAAQKARIVANHAAQGQSTDPTQNSALAQELSSIDMRATAQIAEIATGLYTQGVSMLQIDAGLLNNIYNADVAQNKQVSDALTNFAKALAPSSGVQVKLA